MKNQPLIEQAMSILKEHGYKYTKKREAIITYLVKRNRYLPAKEIHDFMSEEYPGLSYDTIYRNLHDFSEIGILEETEL
ncbi:Fur family transcriptional regulator, partial [Enterococcus faecium]